MSQGKSSHFIFGMPLRRLDAIAMQFTGDLKLGQYVFLLSLMPMPSAHNIDVITATWRYDKRATSKSIFTDNIAV